MMIRDITAADRNEYLAMSRDFYSGDAVLHPVEDHIFEHTLEEALGNNPYLRIVIFEDKYTMGYCQLSFTYSNEVGGPCVLIEEVYVKPEFQGQGAGSQFFAWLFAEYPDAKRFRLELSESNEGAERLYQRLGFQPLPYKQMILDK